MLIHLLILNYNGRSLLQECLPSILRAAEASRHECDVAVIDNSSTDDSVAWLAKHFPRLRVFLQPNRGLCSYNDVLPTLDGPVAIVLNNDIKLDQHAIDPLVAPLVEGPVEDSSPCFMTVPLCWQFDGVTYEGLKTAVQWRCGLIQATAFFPGHEGAIHQPGLTASAGAVVAVDRRKFLALGGFDPLYLPGRLEDLDLALRGYLAGYHVRYVPESVAWHRGMATFAREFGPAGCDQLALRNTLLFQWKNLHHPIHVARQVLGLPLRFVLDVLRAPLLPAQRRWAFTRALLAAFKRLQTSRPVASSSRITRERLYFWRFHPRRMHLGATGCLPASAFTPDATPTNCEKAEAISAR